MLVESVTVEIHEKRNHPHEYGHYDAKVSMTATVEPGDDFEHVITFLRGEARQQVEIECDGWITKIADKRKIDDARAALGTALHHFAGGYADQDDLVNFDQALAVVPEHERGTWREKLEAAQQEALVRVRRDLDSRLEKAKQGQLTNLGRQRFNEEVEKLPEDERAAYHERMEAAVAEPSIAAADEPHQEGKIPF